MSKVAAPLLAIAIGLIGASLACGSSDEPAEEASRPAKTETASPPALSLEERCRVAGVRGETARFESADGVPLEGAVLGGGSVGIVLANQAVGDLCGWVRQAQLLSEQGFRVLVFDYRNTGRSGRVDPYGERAARVDRDIVGAIAELRRRGAERVVLVGASLGGVASLRAAVSARPVVSGIVIISAPDSGWFDRPSVLDPTAAAARVRSPLLFLAVKDDPLIPSAATRKLYDAAAVEDKRLVVVPGYSHGVAVLSDPEVQAILLKFVRDHTAG